MSKSRRTGRPNGRPRLTPEQASISAPKRKAKWLVYSKTLGYRRIVFISRLKCRFGITLANYDKMLMEQSGLCICGKQLMPGDIDHSHVTGKVRGILCHGCNIALGTTGESVSTLRLLISYLEIHNE